MPSKKSHKGLIVFALLVAAGAVAFYLQPKPEPLSSEAAHRPILAALIFDNLNARPEMDFLANAFTRETIAAIGQVCSKDIDVIGHRAVVTYRNSRKSLQQIGRELGVDYLLEGSIQKNKDRLRVTAQLTRASDQTRLWTETYDDSFADAFKIQNKIVQKIATSLGVTPSPSAFDELNRGSTNNAAAREAYLQGVDRCEEGSAAALKNCISLLEAAIKIDADYPRAQGALALALLRSKADPEKAEQHARRAIAGAYAVPQAHLALAEVLYRFRKDNPQADQEFQKAVALNRSDATACLKYADFLRESNRLDEAQLQVRRALSLDPYDLDANVMNGRILTAAKSYQRATAQLEKAVTMDRNNPEIRYYLGQVYLAQSMYDDAIREFQKAVSFGPGVPEYTAALARATAAKPAKK